MKFFIDTEFIEDGKTIDLISVGIVSESGNMFYVVSSEFDASKANDWVRENVLRQIPLNPRMTRAKIADSIVDFVGEKPEFWGYYADYDWVVLCQLYGTMMDLPKGWPMYCRDLKQLLDSLGNPRITKSATNEHHALSDATWIKDTYDLLTCRLYDMQGSVSDADD